MKYSKLFLLILFFAFSANFTPGYAKFTIEPPYIMAST